MALDRVEELVAEEVVAALYEMFDWSSELSSSVVDEFAMCSFSLLIF